MDLEGDAAVACNFWQGRRVKRKAARAVTYFRRH